MLEWLVGALDENRLRKLMGEMYPSQKASPPTPVCLMAQVTI